MIALAAIFAPLLAASLLLLPGLRDFALRVLVPVSAAPALLLALGAPADFEADAGWLLFGAVLGLGAAGRVLLFLTASLWTAAGIYAAAYLATDPGRVRFFVFFALTACGNLGLVLAQDIPTFYMFFTLMTFSAYGLVVHRGDGEAYRAGRIYVIAAIAGEVMVLAALVLVAGETETLRIQDARTAIAASEDRDVIMLLAFGGFGVKAGAALVHFWLPLAHPVAPVPASAVLSGAMIKAGLIGWLHFLPFGIDAYPGWSALLLSFGYVAAFGAAAVGLAQRDAKTVLAYSSVSQMGVITVVLGIGLADPSIWAATAAAVLLFALNHGLAKGALFLGVGVAQRSTSAIARRIVLIALGLAALAIAGAPWTGGALAKHAAASALYATHAEHLAVLPLLMSLSSVATAMLLTHFVALVAREPAGTTALRAGMAVPWGVLAGVAVVVVPMSLRYFAIEFSTEELGALEAAWPVVLGIAAYTAFAALVRRYPIAVPAGDIVVLLERMVQAARAGASRLPSPAPALWQLNFVQYVEAIAATEARRDLSRRLELRLTRWSNAGIAFALLVLVLALLALQ